MRQRSSFLTKLRLKWRRFRLGKRFHHHYQCDPRFNIARGDSEHEVLWDGKKIGTVGHIKSLKQHFNGSCFVIASGPSLNEVDLADLQGFNTLSLNCAIKKFTASQQAPTHCVIVDRRIFENNWDCVEASIRSGANCFFSYVGLSRICERAPELLTQGNIYLVESLGRFFGQPRPDLEGFLQQYQHDPDLFMDETIATNGVIGFSLNAEKGFFSGKTVATWGVQIVNYLGYEKQFIAGMDLGGTGKRHFYGASTNKIPDFLADYEPYIKRCFEQTRRAADTGLFSIYNLSEHSTLPHEIIPKISYDEALTLAKEDRDIT